MVKTQNLNYEKKRRDRGEKKKIWMLCCLSTIQDIIIIIIIGMIGPVVCIRLRVQSEDA